MINKMDDNSALHTTEATSISQERHVIEGFHQNKTQVTPRRKFLCQSLGSVTALALPILFAKTAMGDGMSHEKAMNTHEDTTIHNGHNMNMNMMDHNAHNMMIKPGYELGHFRLTAEDIARMEKADQRLLSSTKMPKGQTLRALPLLENEAKEANKFRGTLRVKQNRVELIPGVETEFYGYNGMLPGPQIVVYEGDKVEIEVINELNEATTVHWHGLLVPADQDGNPQDPILPGEHHLYQFTIPEGSAGTYWYHPHGHNTVAEQVYRGLAGTFVVKTRNDPFKALPEQHLLISDLKLHEDGTIAENSFNDWMNGREGQFTLINGQYQPEIKLDGATRLRLWNACSARYLNLDLQFAECYLIATDGGFIEKPLSLTEILLSPGERIEIIAIPRRNGRTPLTNLSYNRHKMGDTSVTPSQTIATFELIKESKEFKLPATIRKIIPLSSSTPVRVIEYSEEMSKDGLYFLINGKMHSMDRVDFSMIAGEVETWEIFNNSHMDHNFHIHGTQFQVVAREFDGQRHLADYRVLKDTINLKPYERITIVMQQQYTGLRMYHCHILEHETLGMMGQLKVISAT
ncbi:multicopper oxidase family protein [Ignatzschineria larvae DSM 13226]|uniref:Multicopper oxidase family protein n=1 Tax=Ignatzschineria larvae DSM 13226 TaxID=1111732 RepID=A0ABZ3C3J3_9GAMM|nr:multicopper oxidase family protein [Ignatzschineria larvae]